MAGIKSIAVPSHNMDDASLQTRQDELQPIDETTLIHW